MKLAGATEPGQRAAFIAVPASESRPICSLKTRRRASAAVTISGKV